MSGIVFVLFLLCVSFVLSNPISVNTETRALQDDYGRERLFHGVNVIYKKFPYFPITDHFDPRYSFSTEDLEFLQEWGLNVVRLGVMWPGVEPSKNEYNQTYLDIVEEVVANMSRHGIYALIDCHQDDLSEKFCGEGVPLWAAQPSDPHLLSFPLPIDFPYNLSSSGVPTEEDCNKRAWMTYMFTYAAATAYQNIYSNHNGLLDSFAAYWQKLASIFVNYDNVIGYELLNEPFAGDVFADPDLLLPTVADKKNLAPMYDVINQAIRTVDDKHLVFFEPVTWDDFGVGFENVPGGDNYKNRSVLAYHFYIPPDIEVEEAFFVRNREILKSWVVADFLLNLILVKIKIANTASHADKYKQSWIGWEYKVYANITGWGYSVFTENGTMDVPRVATLSRTYPMAVAGKTQGITYSDTSKEFLLKFESSSLTQQPTDIYLNQKLNYPNGYTVTVSPNNFAYNSSHNHIYIWNSAPNTIVTVHITRN